MRFRESAAPRQCLREKAQLMPARDGDPDRRRHLDALAELPDSLLALPLLGERPTPHHASSCEELR